MQRLVDRVAIVTGGSAGIGGATSRRFPEEGAKVLIADVNEKVGSANVARIREAGGTAEFFRADAGRHEDIRAMVQKVVALWGRLDILVNNAYNAIGEANGSAVEISEETWDANMNLLVKAHYLGAKYAVPEMQKTGSGNIINISSVHGLLMAPGRMIYEAGKSAVIGLTRQMATDFGPMGIRVNAICPGHIVTERMELRWNENPTGLRFFEDQYPLRKVGRPVDIANAIVFLCSDEASFITGHALVVDGGLSIQLQEDFGVRQSHYLRANPDTQMPY